MSHLANISFLAETGVFPKYNSKALVIQSRRHARKHELYYVYLDGLFCFANLQSCHNGWASNILSKSYFCILFVIPLRNKYVTSLLSCHLHAYTP